MLNRMFPRRPAGTGADATGALSFPVVSPDEAAKLDGCNGWQMLTRVVWPLVTPSTTITLTLLFIGAFNWFELPYIMAGLDGSPYGSTDVLGLYFYRTAFGNQSAGIQDFGHGNALAVLMFMFIAVVATVITQYLRKREIAL